MQIIIRADEHQVGYVAADIIGTYVVDGAVLGLATGSSPLATYQELIRRCSRGELSFKGCSAYLLDEYVGIHREDPNSYYRTIREEFSAYIDIDDAQVFSPDSTDPDPNSAARRYEEQVVAAGVDVQVLGIGANGHIAFNEPMSSLAGKTTVQALHPQTIADNARFFASIDLVPSQAISQGLGTIMRAKAAVLVATGAAKAEAIHGLIEGPVTASCPASILQMHPDVTVIIDEAAASDLEHRELYRG